MVSDVKSKSPGKELCLLINGVGRSTPGINES